MSFKINMKVIFDILLVGGMIEPTKSVPNVTVLTIKQTRSQKYMELDSTVH